MATAISSVHELAGAPLKVHFVEPAFVNSQHHLTDHVVSVIARKMPRDDGVNAIQETADRKAQRCGQRREFRYLGDDNANAPLQGDPPSPVIP